MTRLEYLLSAAILRALGWCFSRLPGRPNRVVLATARVRTLDGNLLWIRRSIERSRPDLECVTLAEPYGYGLRHKIAYALRLVRGMYHVRTAALVVVDNAWLPIHVAPHGARTTVVQVWHAVGALKRFGRDTNGGLREPERSFLHRYYDHVVTSGEASREPWSRAFGTALERVLPLGSPRTDFFADPEALAAARARQIAGYPRLGEGRVVLYAPTFRGRGRAKRPGPGFDPRRLREELPPGHVLALKSHPNLDPTLVDEAGFDVVIDPAAEMNEILAAADVLVTDYSSSIFEWALLRRPLVLLVEDLAAFEREPGLYLDLRHEAIGELVDEPSKLAAAIRDATIDPAAWSAFVARHLAGCDGEASRRFVERFVRP